MHATRYTGEAEPHRIITILFTPFPSWLPPPPFAKCALTINNTKQLYLKSPNHTKSQTEYKTYNVLNSVDEIIAFIALFKVSPLSNAGRVSVMKHVLACTAAQLATLTLTGFMPKAGSDLAPVQKEKSC